MKINNGPMNINSGMKNNNKENLKNTVKVVYHMWKQTVTEALESLNFFQIKYEENLITMLKNFVKSQLDSAYLNWFNFCI